ncbi:MAG: phosphotransferase [Gemmatimonadales bacterium]
MAEILDPILERLVPLLGELGSAPQPLLGGITNRNYRVTLGGGDYVVRVTSPDTVFLEIDRAAEHAAALSAARLGVGPEVAAFLADQESLVTRFIPGRPISPEELRDSGTLAAVARAVRTFHDGPPIPGTFSPFRVVQSYARTAEARGVPVPRDFRAASRIAGEIEDALQGEEHFPVPCHNDLLNANFIHDGTRARIVDWEYAGMGDRYFDLGNLSINNDLREADDSLLLEHYFGGPGPDRRLACLRLMRIMSDFREAMWGVVQIAVSRIEFDYAAYAAKHFARLQESAADARYALWLRHAGAR